MKFIDLLGRFPHCGHFFNGEDLCSIYIILGIIYSAYFVSSLIDLNSLSPFKKKNISR